MAAPLGRAEKGSKKMSTELKAASRIFFAVTMMCIGAIGLIDASFVAVWAGVPPTFPGRELLLYVCAFLALATGAGMLTKRYAAYAALVLLVYFLVWTIAFKGQFVVRAPLEEGSYQSIGENAVLIAAIWVLYGWFVRNSQTKSNIISGDAGTRIAHIVYGLGLLAFGLSHFFYLDLTAPLVPKWLPEPVFWAYLTGGIYLCTGTAILAGFGARLAAGVAAFQIALITLLVWGPIVLSGEVTPMHWQETIESWALSAGALVLAFSFEGPGSHLGPIPSRDIPSSAAEAPR